MQAKKDITCLNCGCPLQGEENFCPQCGQQNDFRKVSVKEMVFHFLGGFFAFDNLFFRTLKPLLLKPGLVSKDYIEGKRKKYTNPFIFLLHSAIVFLLVVGFIDLFSNSKYKEKHQELLEYKMQHKVDSVFLRTENIIFISDSLISKRTSILKEVYKINNNIEKTLRYKSENSDFIKINENDKVNNFTTELINKKLKEIKTGYILEFINNDSLRYIETKSFNINIKEGKFQNMFNYVFDNSFEEKPDWMIMDELKIEHTRWNVFLLEKIKKTLS